MTTSSQYYRIKNDSIKYENEKKRLNEYNKSKYNNNEEHKKKVLEYQRKRSICFVFGVIQILYAYLYTVFRIIFKTSA